MSVLQIKPKDESVGLILRGAWMRSPDGWVVVGDTVMGSCRGGFPNTHISLIRSQSEHRLGGSVMEMRVWGSAHWRPRAWGETYCVHGIPLYGLLCWQGQPWALPPPKGQRSLTLTPYCGLRGANTDSPTLSTPVLVLKQSCSVFSLVATYNIILDSHAKKHWRSNIGSLLTEASHSVVI